MISSTIQAKPPRSRGRCVRITNARRPRIRPRSSLTPTAPIPPAEVPERPDSAGPTGRPRRRRGRRRSAPRSGGDRRSDRVIGRSASRRFHRFAIGRGHLEEQLLEVARGAGEADDRQPGRRPTRPAAAPTRRRRRGTRARSCRRRGSSPTPRPGRPRTGRAPPRAPRPRAGAGPAGPPRSAAAARCRDTRPWARTWPRSTIATLVHSSSSSGRMWLLMRIVLPSDRSSRSSSRSSTRARGSRPEAGSSSSSTCGSWTSAWARHSRCCMPARQGLDVVVALVAEVDELEQVADHPPPAGRPGARSSGRRSRGTPRPSCRRRPRTRPA